MKRRSHEETSELVAARIQDFVERNASELVLRASLKALGLLRDEIDHITTEAWVARGRLANQDPYYEKSKAWIDKYLKR
jgi:hypothetical protein